MNISVLVYTFGGPFKDGLKDLMFEGNYRQECDLEYDCIFKQKDNHRVTAKLFYSMDAVIVGNVAVNRLRNCFLKKFGSFPFASS